MVDLSKKTMVELRAEFVSLGNQLSVIAGGRHAYDVEIRARVAKAAALVRLSQLSKKDKEALRDAIGEEK